MKIKIFSATIEQLEAVQNWVLEQLQEEELSSEMESLLLICIEEVFVNIASYAYPDSEGMAEVGLELSNHRLTLCFRDGGIPYNPLEKEDPDLEEDLMDRRIGGLGIFMVKNMMDQLEYTYTEGKNCLKMYKNLKGDL